MNRFNLGQLCRQMCPMFLLMNMASCERIVYDLFANTITNGRKAVIRFSNKISTQLMILPQFEKNLAINKNLEIIVEIDYPLFLFFLIFLNKKAFSGTYDRKKSIENLNPMLKSLLGTLRETTILIFLNCSRRMYVDIYQYYQQDLVLNFKSERNNLGGNYVQ